MIPFRCTGCGKSLKVKDEVAGKKVKCPSCGQALRVPEAVASPSPASEGKTLAGPDAGLEVEKSSPPTAAGSLPSASGAAEAATLPPVSHPAPGESNFDSPRSDTLGDEDQEEGSGLTDFLAPAQAPDEIGRLGPYRVLAVLGSGGMGVVFKAEDPQLQRLVALKAMLPSLAAGASARQRFLREARAAAAIKHDHIVAIYQVGQDRGAPFLAMEFLEGEPLDARLRREPPLPLGEVLRIGREAALGLAAAHGRGLIHRDIKPANLWLEAPNGRVKILDFGLARAGGDQAQLTQQVAIVGTPAFMAPEQARGETVDARCDLFSLGSVLYLLATGEMPFKGSDTIAAIMAVVTDEPGPPHEVNPWTPPELSDLVMRLLAKKPEDRPASAQAVADELAAIENECADLAPSRPKVAKRPARKKTAGTSRRPLWVAAGVFLAVGLAAGIYALTRPANQRASHDVRDDREKDVGKDKDGGKNNSPAPVIYGLQFDGRQSFVQLTTLKRDHAAPFTMETWVRPYVTDRLQVVLKVQGSPCQFNLADRWFVADGAYEPRLDLTRHPAENGKAVHLAYVVDGKELRFFVNGLLADRLPAGKKSKLDSRRLMSRFGAEHGGFFFSGVIWETRIAKAARYDKDFTPQKRYESDADTLALYHFDEGQGDVLKDSSGNGHHGKIVGAKWVKVDGLEAAKADRTPPGKEPRKEPPKGEFNNRVVPPLSPLALVARPPAIPGVESWSIEPRGHRGPVAVVAHSRDGKRLASGGDDSTVRLWEPKDGQLQRILLGHAAKVTALAWSPDGKTLASGGEDHVVHLWDLDTGMVLHRLARHTGPVRALAWSPDGKTLASGSADKSARLWDPATGESRRTFDVHKDEVVDVAWQSDKVLVSTSQRGVVRTMWVWEAGSGKTLHSREAKVAVVGWSADRKLLASKTGDKAVTVWDAGANKTRSLALKEQQGPVACLALSPDGKMLATGGETGVRLWDTASGQLLITGEKQNAVTWVSFSPDGKTLASGVRWGRGVSLWKTDSDRKAAPVQRTRYLQGINAGITVGGWSPDGQFVFARNDAGTAQFWDAASGKALQLLPVYWAGNDVAWAPDGKRLAVATRRAKHTLWIWEADTGAFVRAVADISSGGDYVDWSSDAKTLVTSMFNYMVSLWDVESGKPGPRLSGHTSGVFGAVFSPDSKKVASCGRFHNNNKVRISDVAGGPGIDLPAPEVVDQAVGWSPDSRFLATGGLGVRVWDATSGKPAPLKVSGLKNRVHAVAWSPDGETLAAGNALGTVALWNARTGAALKQFQAHDGPVHALAWLADSKTLASLGEKDGRACFWATDTDKPPRVAQGLPGKGRFSPDRRFLVSRSDPTRVQLWDLEIGRLKGTYIQLAGDPDQYLAVSADGHYRISAQAWRYMVYVVRTRAGQETLSPEEFEKKYRWKNEPDKVRLLGK
jgi:WD40 repeat protein/serine/threonine protein kinase